MNELGQDLIAMGVGLLVASLVLCAYLLRSLYK